MIAKVSKHDQEAVKADFWAIFDVGDAEPGDAAIAVATRQAAEFAAKWKTPLRPPLTGPVPDAGARTCHPTVSHPSRAARVRRWRLSGSLVVRRAASW